MKVFLLKGAAEHIMMSSKKLLPDTMETKQGGEKLCPTQTSAMELTCWVICSAFSFFMRIATLISFDRFQVTFIAYAITFLYDNPLSIKL